MNLTISNGPSAIVSRCINVASMAMALKIPKIVAVIIAIHFWIPNALSQPWKSQAKENIDIHRMADLNISVRLQDGTLMNDATIYILQRAHAFTWGTAISIELLRQLEFQGHHFQSDHPYLRHFRNFNSVTPENAGKWNFWKQDAIRSKYLETINWLSELGINNRGHTTIWPSITRWNAVPAEVVDARAIVEGGQVIKSKNDVVREVIKNHIESQLSVLSNEIYAMDLVNELVHEGEITKLVMELPEDDRPGEHALWYQWAKAAAPEIALVANEYDLFQSGNNFHTRFVKYVNDMRTHGAPVDVIGMQGHFFGDIPDYGELKRRLSQVAILGLPLEITEFDMRQNGYEEMERVLYAVFSEPLMQGFSLWGAWDGRQWRGSGAIYNDDWSIKESGKAWFDLVKDQWWTDTLLSVNAGEVSHRVFKGILDVYVESDGLFVHRPIDITKDLSIEIVFDPDQARAVPTADLVIANEKEAYFTNEPIELTVKASDSILSVTYFKDYEFLAVRSQEPFSHTLLVDKKVQTSVFAEVIFRSGYRSRTPLKDLSVNKENAKPRMENLFPPNGSLLIKIPEAELFASAIDDDGDSLTFQVFSNQGQLLHEVEGGYMSMPLENFPAGLNAFRIHVQDNKFGRVETLWSITLLDSARSKHVSISFPQQDDHDVEQLADGSIEVLGDLDLGDRLNAIRFASANLPPQANIDSAWVQFHSQKSGQTGKTVLKIQAEKNSHPHTFFASRNNISRRDVTQHEVLWEPRDWQDLASMHRSPDLSIVLNELVGLDDWAVNSPVHMLIGFDPGLSKRSAYSYDLDPSLAPQLLVHFEYKVPANLDPPDPPSGFHFSPWGENWGELAWESPSPENLLGYKLSFQEHHKPVVSEDRSIVFFDLEPGVEYVLRGQSIGLLGIYSSLSEPFRFIAGQSTVSASQFLMEKIKVFPNPATSVLRFEIPLDIPIDVLIRDVVGNTMLQESVSWGNTMDITSLPPGLYWLELKSQDQWLGLKRIIIH